MIINTPKIICSRCKKELCGREWDKSREPLQQWMTRVHGWLSTSGDLDFCPNCLRMWRDLHAKIEELKDEFWGEIK